MKNLFDIRDRVVVITGGTGVLGKAIAAHLAEEGAKVVILGRKAEVGNAIVADIKAKGGEAMFLTTDVMDRSKLEQNLADILKAYGRVDALLNAAGGNMPGATIGPDGTFFDLKIEEFQRVLELNLTGTVLPTQVFLKPMVEQKKGVIVNFSSMAAFRPMTRVAGYAAAKAGISNYTAFMATEVAKKFGEVRRGHPRERHRPRLLPDRTEPHTADQPRRFVDAARTGRHPPDSFRPHGTSRGAVRNHPVPHQRRFQLRDGYRGRGRRRIQCICHVILKKQYRYDTLRTNLALVWA